MLVDLCYFLFFNGFHSVLHYKSMIEIDQEKRTFLMIQTLKIIIMTHNYLIKQEKLGVKIWTKSKID